jgi:hypothetical protein
MSLKVSFLKSLNTKFKNNKKLRKRLGYLAFTIVIILGIVGFLFLAYNRGYEKIIKTDKDAYVYENFPDTNYGTDDFLRVGNYLMGKTRTYYHFDISSLPSDWRNAYITVHFNFGSKMVDVGADVINETWDEFNITWNNKPNTGIYRGHILCDGFDFRIPITSNHIINHCVSVCLYGRGGIEDGYIQGFSKEGAPKSDEIAWIELSFKGFEPEFLMGLNIFGVVMIIGLIVFAGAVIPYISINKYRKRLKFQEKNVRKNPYDADWINKNISKIMIVPKLEKKINDYIIIRLERGSTYIYVNEKRFIQCIRLVLNIQKEDVLLYDEIESIDEAVKIYNTHIHQNQIIGRPVGPDLGSKWHGITPEQEFWGHCSNIQAWVEHDYDTRILMHNISFPLLRELTKVGDPKAIKVYKEDIAERLESGFPPVVQYLITQEYIKVFSPTEFLSILESTDIIKNLTDQPRILSQFLRSCSSKFPMLLEDILKNILTLPNGKKGFISSMMFEGSSPSSRSIKSYYPTHLNILKKSLETLISQVEEDIMEDVLECIQYIDNQLKKQFLFTPERTGKEYLNLIRNELLDGIAFDELDERQKFSLQQIIQNRIGKIGARCSYCGKVIPKGKDICDWCGHQRDDDEGFFPYPYIYKPPGGGGGRSKEGALSIPIKV